MTVVNPKSISGINSITTGSGSDNLLTIHTSDANNTERFRVDSTGRTRIKTGIVTSLTVNAGVVTTLTATTVGIGTTNAQKQLSLRAAGSSTFAGVLVKCVNYANNQDNTYLTVGGENWNGATTNWGTYGFQHRIKSNSSGTARVTIDTKDGEAFCVETGKNVGIQTNNPTTALDVNGTATIKGGIVNSGSINMVSSHLQFSGQTSLPNVGATLFRPVADTIAFGINNGQRVSVNQYGLLFGTDTAEVNALNDYEEGTFTPVVANAGSGGNAASSYEHQLGWYTKIGNLVNIQIRLRNIVEGGSISGSDTIYIRGFPFAMEAATGRIVVGHTNVANFNVPSNCFGLSTLTNNGTQNATWCRLFASVDNADHSDQKFDSIGSTNQIQINLTYRTT